MPPRILVLALASFAMGTETHVFAGHLAALATELGVTVAVAGQLATAFALTYAVSAPVIASFCARFDRKTVLIVGLLLLGVLNIAAAAVPSFTPLIVIRILCGIAAGLVGPAAPAAAAVLAPPEKRGKALAVVLAGLTLAFVLGVPLGSVVGDLFDWRATFVFSGILAFLAAAATGIVLPRVPGGERAGLKTLLIARERRVALPLLLTMVGLAATFCVISYIGPVVNRISGLEGSGVGAMQALIGIGSIAGLALGGIAADRAGAPRLLVGSFFVTVAAMGGYSALLAAQTPEHASLGQMAATGLLALTIMAGAVAVFARAPIIQASLVAAVPEARAVALALNSSMVFVGQGLGAAIGGLVIAEAGVIWVGAAGAVLGLLGIGLALTSLDRTPVPAPKLAPEMAE